VRLRILQAAHDRRPVTTTELAELLPDVAKATLYRHVALLVDHGLLEVESEQRVRGAVERRYRLHPGRARVDDRATAAMTADDHRRGLAAVLAALLAEFDSYLSRGADPVADQVGYRHIALWLDDDEKADLVEQVVGAIRTKAANGPRPGRRRHVLSPIFFPTE
jgi:DNA-binding transcriptional ArsR family regulator